MLGVGATTDGNNWNQKLLKKICKHYITYVYDDVSGKVLFTLFRFNRKFFNEIMDTLLQFSENSFCIQIDLWLINFNRSKA